VPSGETLTVRDGLGGGQPGHSRLCQKRPKYIQQVTRNRRASATGMPFWQTARLVKRWPVVCMAMMVFS